MNLVIRSQRIEISASIIIPRPSDPTAKSLSDFSFEALVAQRTLQDDIAVNCSNNHSASCGGVHSMCYVGKIPYFDR